MTMLINFTAYYEESVISRIVPIGALANLFLLAKVIQLESLMTRVVLGHDFQCYCCDYCHF